MTSCTQELGAAGDLQSPTNSPTEPANGLPDLTVNEFHRLLSRGEVTVLDYARACADRIERFDNLVGAFEVFDRLKLESEAAAMDEQIAANSAFGALTGVPIGVKDIFNTRDYPSSRGSPILTNYTPGNDARVISDARNEGALVAGKTVTAEFGVHSPGKTVNPHDRTRTPGTSSSGSAAAVASRMVPIGLATQTGGSIIRPASYCGVVGYKPSFGLVPRTGVLKTTDTLDTVGFMARNVDDVRLTFETTRVKGRNYPMTDGKLVDPSRRLKPGQRWRVGVLQGPSSDHEAEVAKQGLAAIVASLKASGAEIEEFILPPAFNAAHDIHERIYCKSLAYYFQDEWRMRPDLFSPQMKEMMEAGADITLDQFNRDVSDQSALSRSLDLALTEPVDVVIGLSTADEAPVGIDAPDFEDHCLIWTLCGVPTISLPLLTGQNGLPIGVQVIARKYSDYLLLSFAEHLLALCRK